jgi:hypothetical protein
LARRWTVSLIFQKGFPFVDFWYIEIRKLTIMQNQLDPIDRAIRQLHERRTFRHGDREIVIAFLVRTDDWRPLKAPWWRGKEAYIIGTDLNGNFLLRHCDGTVRFWDHHLQSDEVIARSIKDFVSGIV